MDICFHKDHYREPNFGLYFSINFSFNSTALAKDKLSQKDKLLEMGLEREEISKLYDGQKEFLEKMYDDSEGRVKRLTAKEIEEVSPQGISDIEGIYSLSHYLLGIAINKTLDGI